MSWIVQRVFHGFGQTSHLMSRLSLEVARPTLTCTDVSKKFCSKPNKYDPRSPYRNPGPRRYGFQPKLFQGGLLPRKHDLPLPLPTYKPGDPFAPQKAVFGQNDYIDILGNGEIHPRDLITGPRWLVRFRGNELQRLIRQMSFEGEKLKMLYPSRYHSIRKRIKFLNAKYNIRRGKRVG